LRWLPAALLEELGLRLLSLPHCVDNFAASVDLTYGRPGGFRPGKKIEKKSGKKIAAPAQPKMLRKK
jgi:hypothetical protein